MPSIIHNAEELEKHLRWLDKRYNALHHDGRSAVQRRVQKSRTSDAFFALEIAEKATATHRYTGKFARKEAIEVQATATERVGRVEKPRMRW